jgi:hypothetical protein
VTAGMSTAELAEDPGSGVWTSPVTSRRTVGDKDRGVCRAGRRGS